jgi:hypothetical protein
MFQPTERYGVDVIMHAVTALQKVWEKIYRPGSACPDVEIGYVHQVLAEVLAEVLKDSPSLESEASRFVLGSILISPKTKVDLDHEWFESKHVYSETPKPKDYNYEDPEYQVEITKYYEKEEQEQALRSQEVKEALEKLVDMNLIVLKSNTEDERFPKYCPQKIV